MTLHLVRGAAPRVVPAAADVVVVRRDGAWYHVDATGGPHGPALGHDDLFRLARSADRCIVW